MNAASKKQSFSACTDAWDITSTVCSSEKCLFMLLSFRNYAAESTNAQFLFGLCLNTIRMVLCKQFNLWIEYPLFDLEIQLQLNILIIPINAFAVSLLEDIPRELIFVSLFLLSCVNEAQNTVAYTNCSPDPNTLRLLLKRKISTSHFFVYREVLEIDFS